MKKWSEIQTAILHVLFLTEDEAAQQNYSERMLYFANECLDFISNAVKPKITTFEITTTSNDLVVRMPEDFLSHSGLLNYRNDKPNPRIVYVTRDRVQLIDKGDYKLSYNARWSYINENYNGDLEIDESILMCLPSYIGSKLLAQDDIQRSTILRNEFELMISRLDTEVTNDATSFHSIGGWY